MDYFEKRAGIPTVGCSAQTCSLNYRVGLDYAHSTGLLRHRQHVQLPRLRRHRTHSPSRGRWPVHHPRRCAIRRQTIRAPGPMVPTWRSSGRRGQHSRARINHGTGLVDARVERPTRNARLTIERAGKQLVRGKGAAFSRGGTGREKSTEKEVADAVDSADAYFGAGAVANTSFSSAASWPHPGSRSQTPYRPAPRSPPCLPPSSRRAGRSGRLTWSRHSALPGGSGGAAPRPLQLSCSAASATAHKWRQTPRPSPRSTSAKHRAAPAARPPRALGRAA